MNINQLLKWRRDILMGKNKYYPKGLIPNLIAFNAEYEKRDETLKQIEKELEEVEKQQDKNQK